MRTFDGPIKICYSFILFLRLIDQRICMCEDGSGDGEGKKRILHIRDTRRRFVDRKPDGRESKAGYVCHCRNRKENTHSRGTGISARTHRGTPKGGGAEAEWEWSQTKSKVVSLVINTSSTHTSVEVWNAACVGEQRPPNDRRSLQSNRFSGHDEG